MSELISIVVPTYNRSRLIKRCVENLREQTYPDYEILVIDDGSTDGTDSVMENLTDSVVRYYRLEKNQGACAARNKGVELAKGDYIAFQDSDDLWEKDKLEKQMAYLKEKKLDVVFCSMQQIKDGKARFVVPEAFVPSDRIFSKLCNTSFISTQMLLGKKECFEKEPFDPAMPRLQDYDIMLRLSQKYRIGHLPEVLVSQYVCEDSISNNKEKYRKAVKLLAEKYRDIPEFIYQLYLENGYRNYYAEYGFNSKALFRRAWREKKTVKAFLLCLIPDFILRPYVRKMHGK